MQDQNSHLHRILRMEAQRYIREAYRVRDQARADMQRALEERRQLQQTVDSQAAELAAVSAERDTLATQLDEARGHKKATRGKNPVHPEYGPCDSFLPGGACSQCTLMIEQLRSQVETLRKMPANLPE